jgi:hypothetical protein
MGHGHGGDMDMDMDDMLYMHTCMCSDLAYCLSALTPLRALVCVCVR